MRTLVLKLLAGVVIASLTSPLFAQTAVQPRPEGGQRRGGGGGEQRPAFPRAADALERVTFRTRAMLSTSNRATNWINWRFGISSQALGNLTFHEAVIRADAAQVNFIEGSSSQQVSRELPKNLDSNLTADEIAAVRAGMGGIRMHAYRVDNLGADAAARRKVFEFAKAMDAEIIVAPLGSATAAEVDELANEFEINVALAGRPETMMQALEGRSRRLSVAADTGTSMEHNRTPLQLLSVVKDRLSYVSLRDRSAIGDGGRDVLLGTGAGQFAEFFREMNRLGMRGLTLTLNTAGTVQQPGDLYAAVDAFEAAVQPAYGEFFTAFSKTKPEPRLYLDERSRRLGNREEMPDEEMRAKMAAAVKTVTPVKPQKARKLLVIESLHGMYHNPGIPNCNVLLDMMGKATGAWVTEFSNDLDNLKYPKIKEYDAVFVNSAVNEMFPDPLVREGLARFVKEGGGMGGIHGTPWATRGWQEFADMIGARTAPHRVEDGVMKVHDPASPLVKSFAGKDLPFREEFYRFQKTGYDRLMWENMRVVLTVTTSSTQDNAWMGNTYPMSWVRSYGQGRTFYCSLGHMAETFMQPEIVGHLCAGVQFLLGDLEVDTTPNPPATAAAQP